MHAVHWIIDGKSPQIRRNKIRIAIVGIYNMAQELP